MRIIQNFAAAAGAAGMLLGGLGATTAASAAPATRYHYSHPYVLYMANRDTEAMKVRPSFIKIMTGLRLSRLRWRYWNANSGKGRGDVTDSAGKFPVSVWVGHPVWTPAPMGPTEFRTFKQITVQAGNGYFRYTWHQDYAMGGHWSLARHWAGAGLAPAGTTTQATATTLMSVRLPVAYTGAGDTREFAQAGSASRMPGLRTCGGASGQAPLPMAPAASPRVSRATWSTTLPG